MQLPSPLGPNLSLPAPIGPFPGVPGVPFLGPGDIRRYGARCDGVTDDAAAIDLAFANNKIVIGPAGGTSFTSRNHIVPAGGTFQAYGFTLVSSASVGIRQTNFSVIQGLTLQRSTPLAGSVGIAVGDAGNTGHHSKQYDVDVTGFDDGIVTQLSFYCVFNGCDSHRNANRNWRFFNTAISNDLVGCKGRGEQFSRIGLVVDDTVSNATGMRLFGGTFEGNVVQQLAFLGGDSCGVYGSHLECNSPVDLTGTVSFTNGSTAVTGVGTAFVAEILPQQYVKVKAHAGEFFRRVLSVTNNTNLVLEEVYDGATVGGVAGEVAGGCVYVGGAGGVATRNKFDNLEMSATSGLVPGMYVGGGSSETQIISASLTLPTITSRTASRAQFTVTSFPGGLNDQCPDSSLRGDSSNGRTYDKIGTAIGWREVPGGLITVLTVNNMLGFGANQRGQFQVAGGVASINVPTVNVGDTNYFVCTSAGPTASTGAPAAGSNRILSIVKAAAQFTVTLEAAPGAGNTQTFDYWIVR